MNLDTSTTNILLASGIALQCWIVRELYRVKGHLAILMSKCPLCKQHKEQNDL